MKERGILFSAPMVRALLNGSKTQTRRALITPESVTEYRHWNGDTWERMQGRQRGDSIKCPYGAPGRRLWVRETWGLFQQRADKTIAARVRGGCVDGDGYAVHYRATDTLDMPSGAWRPSIHMFRADSRINLDIISVRIERLQDISEADALAEGAEEWARGALSPEGQAHFTAVEKYEYLWNSINGAGAWHANPWVWVIAFRRSDFRVLESVSATTRPCRDKTSSDTATEAQPLPLLE